MCCKFVFVFTNISLVPLAFSGLCASPHRAEPHDVEAPVIEIVEARVVEEVGGVPRERLRHRVDAMEEHNATIGVVKPVVVWINLQERTRTPCIG